jgi:hypothetical protein
MMAASGSRGSGGILLGLLRRCLRGDMVKGMVSGDDDVAACWDFCCCSDSNVA